MMAINAKNYPWKQGAKLYVYIYGSDGVLYRYIDRDITGILLSRGNVVAFIPWTSIEYLEFDEDGDDRK